MPVVRIRILRHDGRADKNPYRHDSRADKNPYRHDRRTDSQYQNKHYYFHYYYIWKEELRAIH